MNHVLEHLYNPRETLTRLCSKMPQGGRLHLATPNAASATFRLFGKCWFPLDCPRHIVIYTPCAASRLLHGGVASRLRLLSGTADQRFGSHARLLVAGSRQARSDGRFGHAHSSGIVGIAFHAATFCRTGGAGDRFHAIAVA